MCVVGNSIICKTDSLQSPAGFCLYIIIIIIWYYYTASTTIIPHERWPFRARTTTTRTTVAIAVAGLAGAPLTRCRFDHSTPSLAAAIADRTKLPDLWPIYYYHYFFFVLFKTRGALRCYHNINILYFITLTSRRRRRRRRQYNIISSTVRLQQCTI